MPSAAVIWKTTEVTAITYASRSACEYILSSLTSLCGFSWRFDQAEILIEFLNDGSHSMGSQTTRCEHDPLVLISMDQSRRACPRGYLEAALSMKGSTCKSQKGEKPLWAEAFWNRKNNFTHASKTKSFAVEPAILTISDGGQHYPGLVLGALHLFTLSQVTHLLSCQQLDY